MCPYVKMMDEERPDTIQVEIEIPRSAATWDSINESLPELKNELAARWPVQEVRWALWNPVSLSQWEISILIGLATPILRPLGEKLRDEAFKWLRRRFKRATKKKRKRRRH